MNESQNKALKWSVLVWLSFQNSVHTLLVRYSRARRVEHLFFPSCAVFSTEILKFCICLVAVFIESGGFKSGSKTLWERVVGHPLETAKVCVPSLIYTVQNNLFYMAASHLNAATFMVTCQLKLLTTAIFAVLLLGTRLSRLQWAALCLLFTGVACVQWEEGGAPSESGRPQNALLGLFAVVVASTLSGLSGVWFEKILKDAMDVSVWMRNVQMAICALPLSLAAVALQDGAQVRSVGLFYGFDSVVWLTVFWYGIGGLTVAITIKYADNILKNFSTSVAIIFSTVASMYIFNFKPTWFFVFGTVLVIVSIFLYSVPKTISTSKDVRGSTQNG